MLTCPATHLPTKKTVGRTTGNSSSSWRERREGGTEVEGRQIATYF